MGSFDSTCCISGLPLHAGRPVRWLLLQESPYCDGGFVCESHGRWVPRTWPIKAYYNDYGSIEDIEEGPLKDLVMKGFQTDLIEKGVGDNSYHDVASKKDMTFEQMLEAVWEGRVWVSREAERRPITEELRRKWEEQHPAPDYIPTMRNIELCLEGVQKLDGGRFLVDAKEDHFRVRWDGLSGGYGKDAEYLAAATIALSHYATVITAGSGSYAHSQELRVFMAPGKTDQGHDRRMPSNETIVRPLLVQQAMIREDVWQALIAMKVEGHEPKTYKRRNYSIDDYRRSISEYATKMVQKAEERRNALERLKDPNLTEGERAELSFKSFRFSGLDEREAYDYHAGLLAKDAVPFTVGLASHAEILMEEGPLPPGFTSLVAELTFIWHVLGNVRYVWRPSDTAGPQFGDEKDHVAYLRTLLNVAKAEARRVRKEYGR